MWLPAAALCTTLLVALAPLGVGGQEAEPQDEEPTGLVWTNTTDLSWVSTGGNASSSTLGLSTVFLGKNALNELRFEGGGIRSETRITTTTAVGTSPDDFELVEEKRTELTAENFFARGRYDRTLGTVLAFGGAGWDRNTFAGIDNRYNAVAGVGRAFVDADDARFKADLGVTYTLQKDLVPTPGVSESFGGLRLSYDAMKKLSSTTEFASLLLLDQNLNETTDLRADWLNSLAVSMSETLAFRTSLQLLFDNLPSLLSVPLRLPDGTPQDATVTVPAKKWDSILTVSLVITM
jgi:putative salt-induced outer membrane protein YdiY